MKRTGLIIGLVLLVGGIILLLPAMRTDVGTSRLTYDINSLKQIGLACRLFAGDHGGKFPAEWSQLQAYASTPIIFRSSTHIGPVGNFQDVMTWTDYVYIRNLTTSAPSNQALAFLPPGHFKKRPTTGLVLFVDSHVETVELQDFASRINVPQNGR